MESTTFNVESTTFNQAQGYFFQPTAIHTSHLWTLTASSHILFPLLACFFCIPGCQKGGQTLGTKTIAAEPPPKRQWFFRKFPSEGSSQNLSSWCLGCLELDPTLFCRGSFSPYVKTKSPLWITSCWFCWLLISLLIFKHLKQCARKISFLLGPGGGNRWLLGV